MTDSSPGAHAEIVVGFDRLLNCTTDFEPGVSFARDVLGLKLADEGTARTDKLFSRYARMVLPSGATLAIVEPNSSARDLRGRQIMCLRVRDIMAARAALDQRGAVFASEMIDDGEGLGRVYLHAPAGNIYQLFGPFDGREASSSVLAESRDKPDAAAITGFDWVLSCATEFEPAVSFVREVLGLAITEQGVARIDTRFTRYACAPLPGGGTLETVEPAPYAAHLNGRQITCFRVGDIVAARVALDQRGAVFASDLIDDGEGLGWIYVQAPDGNLYQIYGPTSEPGSAT